MFNSYEMTRAFVAERQGTLRHEARERRLGRRSGRGHRGGAVVRSLRPATGPGQDRLAA
jgi:hypothetical protein